MTMKVLTGAYGWPTGEAEALIMEVRREAKNKSERVSMFLFEGIWTENPKQE